MSVPNFDFLRACLEESLEKSGVRPVTNKNSSTGSQAHRGSTAPTAAVVPSAVVPANPPPIIRPIPRRVFGFFAPKAPAAVVAPPPAVVVAPPAAVVAPPAVVVAPPVAAVAPVVVAPPPAAVVAPPSAAAVAPSAAAVAPPAAVAVDSLKRKHQETATDDESDDGDSGDDADVDPIDPDVDHNDQSEATVTDDEDDDTPAISVTRTFLTARRKKRVVVSDSEDEQGNGRNSPNTSDSEDEKGNARDSPNTSDSEDEKGNGRNSPNTSDSEDEKKNNNARNSPNTSDSGDSDQMSDATVDEEDDEDYKADEDHEHEHDDNDSDSVPSTVRAPSPSPPPLLLRPHQKHLNDLFKDNAQVMKKLPGMLLYHSVGSGKTITMGQMLQTMLGYPDYEDVQIIWVTKKNLLKASEAELKRHFPGQEWPIKFMTINRFISSFGAFLPDEKGSKGPKRPRGRPPKHAALSTPLGPESSSGSLGSGSSSASGLDSGSASASASGSGSGLGSSSSSSSSSAPLTFSLLLPKPKTIVIIDEAHNVANPKTMTHHKLLQILDLNQKAVMQTPGAFQKLFLMTGTPARNKIYEIFSLFNLILKCCSSPVSAFCNSGRLEVVRDTMIQKRDLISTLLSFYKEDKNSSEYKSHYPQEVYRDVKIPVDPKIWAMILQYRKQILFDYDDGKFAYEGSETEEDENNDYMEEDISNKQKKARKFLGKAIRCDMACNATTFKDPETGDPVIGKAKIEYAVRRTREFLAENRDRKVVIFMRYLEAHNVLRQDFQAAGIKLLTVTGKQKLDTEGNEQKAEVIINQFNQPDGPRVIAISPATSEGTSLLRVGLFMVADSQWTEAEFKQIVARGIRFNSHVSCAEKVIVAERLVLDCPQATNIKEKKLQRPCTWQKDKEKDHNRSGNDSGTDTDTDTDSNRTDTDTDADDDANKKKKSEKTEKANKDHHDNNKRSDAMAIDTSSSSNNNNNNNNNNNDDDDSNMPQQTGLDNLKKHCSESKQKKIEGWLSNLVKWCIERLNAESLQGNILKFF